MTKKELLIRILQGVVPHRPAAEGFLLMVEDGAMSDELLNSIVHWIHQALEHQQSQAQKETLTNAKVYIQQLQKVQEKATLEDQNELLALEKELDALEE